MDKRKVGLNIRKLRELKNYTQAYMSQELGMSNSGYGQIERGLTDINISRLMEIASVLGTTPEEILFFNPNKLIRNESASENYGEISTQRHESIEYSEFADLSLKNEYYDILLKENEFLKNLFLELLNKKKKRQQMTASNI